MTESLYALTMESAQAWAFLVLAMASAAASFVAAYFAARAKSNSAAVVTQSHVNSDKLTEIHQKADTAIAQNEAIKDQTDGHYTALTEILAQVVEGLKERPAVVAVPADPPPPRKVRKEDLERAAAAKKDPA